MGLPLQKIGYNQIFTALIPIPSLPNRNSNPNPDLITTSTPTLYNSNSNLKSLQPNSQPNSTFPQPNLDDSQYGVPRVVIVEKK